MRYARYLAVASLLAPLATAGAAQAWTPEDCAKINYNHPDCQQYQPPPPPPPVTPLPLPVPPSPPVSAPAPTPPSPVPVSTPPTPTAVDVPPVEAKAKVAPKAQREQVKPQADIGTPVRAQSSPVSQPVVERLAKLPFTGLSAGLVALVGSLLFGVGLLLRRRTLA